MRVSLLGLFLVLGGACLSPVHDNPLGDNDGGTGGGSAASTGGGSSATGGGSSASGGGNAGMGGGTSGAGGNTQQLCNQLCGAGEILTPRFAAVQLSLASGTLLASGFDFTDGGNGTQEVARIDTTSGAILDARTDVETPFGVGATYVSVFTPFIDAGTSLEFALSTGGTAPSATMNLTGVPLALQQLGVELYVQWDDLDNTTPGSFARFQKLNFALTNPDAEDALPAGVATGDVKTFSLWAQQGTAATDIFFVDDTGVHRYNLASQQRTEISVAAWPYTPLIVEGNTLYFQANDTIFSAFELSTSKLTIPYSPTADEFTPMLKAISEGVLFFTYGSTGQRITLRQVDLTTGAKVDVFPAVPVDNSNTTVAVTADTVYYSGGDIGAIYRRARACCP